MKVFISYKWETEEHSAWVRRLATSLRERGIEAILDQWEVRLGDSFTDYMQQHISSADVILFVITPGAVAAAEAPRGEGGALKFEVQMMNARRIAGGVRIVGVYRSGDRPPHYLRDHRYVDFREDEQYERSLQVLVDDLLGRVSAPPLDFSTGPGEQECREIANRIDPWHQFTGGSREEVSELTKRLLFHVVRDLFSFSFQDYRRWIEWARSNGYQVPGTFVFTGEERWRLALNKVEVLNRQGFQVAEIDASELFGVAGVALG